MTETPEEKYLRELRVFEEKDIQNYSVQLTAWFNTKLEKDKSIITISSAAIGLLVTILTSKGISSLWQVSFYLLSFASFLVAIITAIDILDKNAEQIEKDLTAKGNINKILGRSDLIIKRAFYAGIIFTILLGGSYGVSQYVKEKGEKKMAAERIKADQEKNESYIKSNLLKVTPPIPPVLSSPQNNNTKKEK